MASPNLRLIEEAPKGLGGAPEQITDPCATVLHNGHAGPLGVTRQPRRWQKGKVTLNHPTRLAAFVCERLAALDLRQSEFCRLNGFDQGLLSRIQNSMITSISVETVLRLAIGLAVSPKKIFDLIGRSDLHELVIGAYSFEWKEINTETRSLPESASSSLVAEKQAGD